MYSRLFDCLKQVVPCIHINQSIVSQLRYGSLLDPNHVVLTIVKGELCRI